MYAFVLTKGTQNNYNTLFLHCSCTFVKVLKPFPLKICSFWQTWFFFISIIGCINILAFYSTGYLNFTTCFKIIFSWNCGFINICGHLFVNKGKITISKIQKFVAKGQRDKILIEIALQQILNFVAKYNNEIHENLYSTEIDETTTILIRKYMAMCSCRWISYTVKHKTNVKTVLLRCIFFNLLLYYF